MTTEKINYSTLFSELGCKMNNIIFVDYIEGLQRHLPEVTNQIHYSSG